MLGVNESLHCLNEILWLVIENSHELGEDEIFFLLISQEEEGNPFLNRLRSNLPEIVLININDVMLNKELKQA